MATLSSYLNGKPEYLALLGQKASDFGTSSIDRDVVRLVTFLNGKPVHDTGEISEKSLLSNDVVVSVRCKDRFRFYQLLYYVIRRRGQRWSYSYRFGGGTVRFLKKSQVVQFSVGGKLQQYLTAIRKGRGGASKKAYPLRSGASTPLSRSLRPNPEIRNVVFPRAFQTDAVPLQVTAVSREVHRRTWFGSRTPGYGRIPKKKLPVNPHASVLKDVPLGFSFRYSFGFKPPLLNTYTLQIFPYLEVLPEPATPGFLDQARDKAVSRILEKAELEIDANLAQDFAQIGQMTQLIGTNVSRITKSIRSLKKGNFPGAINALTAGRSRVNSIRKGKPSRTKDLAENWLELQYGWKPLLHDIYGATKALSTLQAGSPFVQQVASSAKAEKTTTSKFSSNYFNIPANSGTLFERSETRCKIVLRWRVASPLQVFLAQTGFTNPVNLIWEILPFSFVVDWFLPIGPYLSALSAWDGLTFLDGSQTRFARHWTDSSVDFSGVSVLNSSVFEEVHQRFSRNLVQLHREKLETFPTLSLPSFKNGLASVDHALNGLALLRAAFMKR